MVVVFENKSTTLRDWVRTLEPSAVKVEIYLDSPRMKGMYSFCMMSLLGCPVNRRTVPLPWVLHPWHVMLMSYRRKSGQLYNFATYNSLCSNIIMYDWRSKPKTFAHVTLMSCMAMKVEDIYQTLLSKLLRALLRLVSWVLIVANLTSGWWQWKLIVISFSLFFYLSQNKPMIFFVHKFSAAGLEVEKEKFKRFTVIIIV